MLLRAIGLTMCYLLFCDFLLFDFAMESCSLGNVARTPSCQHASAVVCSQAVAFVTTAVEGMNDNGLERFVTNETLA